MTSPRAGRTHVRPDLWPVHRAGPCQPRSRRHRLVFLCRRRTESSPSSSWFGRSSYNDARRKQGYCDPDFRTEFRSLSSPSARWQLRTCAMIFRVSLFLVIVLLVAADSSKDDANKKDMAIMQGDWAAESMTKDGFKLPDDDAQALFRTVKGNDYTVYRYDKIAGKGSFTIDATKK